MNFHWGKKIAVFYMAFVIMMMVFVVRACQENPELEREDYYEQEIRYGERMERMKNSQALPEALLIRYESENSQMLVRFPTELHAPSGSIFFYRPSDKSLDFTVEVAPDTTGYQRVSTAGLKSGLWQIQVEWDAGMKGYYDELNVVLE